jgi:hypothetical protein
LTPEEEIIKSKASVVSRLLDETYRVADMVYKNAIINSRTKVIENDDKKELVSWANGTAKIYYFWRNWANTLNLGDSYAERAKSSRKYNVNRAQKAKKEADGFYEAAKKQIDDLGSGKTTLKPREGLSGKQETDRKNNVLNGWKKLHNNLILEAIIRLWVSYTIYIRSNTLP